MWVGDEIVKKLGILYATMTGHSRKIAKAIGEALDVQALNVGARPAFADVDLLFIVGGIYGGRSLPALLNYVKALDKDSVRRAVLVTSSARKQKQDDLRKLLHEKGIEVLDEFTCPGSFLFLSFGHPNKEDIEQAVDFAVKISAKTSEPAP